MKILFICKWNRFRSRTAEAYFNKINKNKQIKAESAGLFQGSYPLSVNQVKAGKELGINMNGKPRTISYKLLQEIDLIVITANDVPKQAFKTQYYTGKIKVWKIPDVDSGRDIEENKKIIRKIFKKVNTLIKELK